jgi:hypothetical protein
MDVLQKRRRVLPLEHLALDPVEIDLTLLAIPPWDNASISDL